MSMADESSSKKRKSHDEIAIDVSLSEPLSKKARRAQKKGVQLVAPPTQNADDDNSNTRATANAVAVHGVWIGNLAYTTTRESLMAFLVDCSGGSITNDSIVRVKIPTTREDSRKNGDRQKPAGTGNKGFAYVDFNNEASKYAAIGLSETELEGRKLLIKDSQNFEGRPASTAKQEEDTKKGLSNSKAASKSALNDTSLKPGPQKVYIGNLPFETSEDELRFHFEKCGMIKAVHVATFEDSGKCKGFAWITFADGKAAGSAVRGFAKVEEIAQNPDSTENTHVDGDGSVQEKKGAKRTFRKWWVNHFKGRDLKIELAEDNQTRYQKRFGKGAKKTSQVLGSPDHKTPNNETDVQSTTIEKIDTVQPAATQPKAVRSFKKESFCQKQAYAEQGDSYRTGGIVKATNKKVVFD